MNERIRELWIKSASEDSDPNNWDTQEQFIERFARLIVLECAKSANDWYQNHDKIHSDPMSYILAHFGVEE